MPSTAPLLGPLADNGGMTLTHSVRSASPTIDRGNPAGCLDENGQPLAVDQRKFPRVADGDGTAICDIGALELRVFVSPAPVLGWLGLFVLCAALGVFGARRLASGGVAFGRD